MKSFFAKLFSPAAPAAPAVTFRELAAQYSDSRKQFGLRPVTLQNSLIFCRRITRELGPLRLDTMTSDAFERLLEGRSLTFREHMKAMARWAVEQRILANDITGNFHRRPILADAKAPAYLTPSEAQRFYAAIREEFVPAFTLAMYAGVRPYEVCRLDWRDINIRERRLRIGAEVSKIRRARIIEDVPTILWAQLALHEKHDGPIIPKSIRPGAEGGVEKTMFWHWSAERARAAKLALVPMVPDVLRHTFATYFVALTGSPDKAAKVLGHFDLRMLSTHYDGIATKQEAEDYFHPKPIMALPAPRETCADTRNG